LIFQLEPFGEPPPNHGGYAGLSVPTVSVPSSTRFSESFAQPGIADAAAGADELAIVNADATATTASAPTASRIFLMSSNTLLVWPRAIVLRP
jgi:hypothetical protein